MFSPSLRFSEISPLPPRKYILYSEFITQRGLDLHSRPDKSIAHLTWYGASMEVYPVVRVPCTENYLHSRPEKSIAQLTWYEVSMEHIP